jgi:hypothetical protein
MFDKNNKIQCKITKDLLINCAIKSHNLNECNVLKLIINKFCKENINTNSSK